MASIKHFVYMMQDLVCRRDVLGSGQVRGAVRALVPPSLGSRTRAAQFVLIYDRRGCTRVNSDVAMFKRLLRLYQLNYPATLYRCYVLNPDAVFYYAFLAVRTVMSRHARGGPSTAQVHSSHARMQPHARPVPPAVERLGRGHAERH